MRFSRPMLDGVVSAMFLFVGGSPLVAGAAAPAAEPQVAQRREQAPGVYRYRVGDFQVTALSDGTLPLDVHPLLQGIAPAETDKLLQRAFLSNPVETSVTAYLIDTGSRRILVDTGAGALFGPTMGGKLMANLKAAGYGPEQIDDILITHAHLDHIGGLVHEGQRVFPRATVHLGKGDTDLFLDPTHQAGFEGYDKSHFENATKTLGPYQKAGKIHTFSQETQLYPGIKALPTPGHTPGHSFFLVESRGQAVQFIGDIIHVAAVQFAHPAITVGFDFKSKDAAVQREKQFTAAAQNGLLLAGSHLPYPGLGHIRAEAEGYTYVPVDYVDR